MTKSHSDPTLVVAGEPWRPVRPPKRGGNRTAFHAYMLLPGFSLAFHAAALGRSRSSLYDYRTAALAAAQSDSAIITAVDVAVRAIQPEDGLQMARARGKAQLPAWSRLAIGEYRRRGFSRKEIADAFGCSVGTVANVLQGKGTVYGLFSGERRLSFAQRNPPGRWLRSERSGSRLASH